MAKHNLSVIVVDDGEDVELMPRQLMLTKSMVEAVQRLYAYEPVLQGKERGVVVRCIARRLNDKAGTEIWSAGWVSLVLRHLASTGQINMPFKDGRHRGTFTYPIPVAA